MILSTQDVIIANPVAAGLYPVNLNKGRGFWVQPVYDRDGALDRERSMVYLENRRRGGTAKRVLGPPQFIDSILSEFEAQPIEISVKVIEG